MKASKQAADLGCPEEGDEDEGKGAILFKLSYHEDQLHGRKRILREWMKSKVLGKASLGSDQHLEEKHGEGNGNKTPFSQDSESNRASRQLSSHCQGKNAGKGKNIISLRG